MERMRQTESPEAYLARAAAVAAARAKLYESGGFFSMDELAIMDPADVTAAVNAGRCANHGIGARKQRR